MNITILAAAFVTFVPYIIIIICNIKILNHLKRQRHSLSTASRRLQSDLNKTLLAQAIIPIFSAFLPMGIHITGAIFDIDLVFASFISGILYCWIPTGNAISVLFFVTAYRIRLKNLLLQVRPKLSRVFSVTNTVTASS